MDVFTAAENIVLGLDEGGRLDIKAANAKVKEICDRYGFDIDPTQKIYDMSVSQKQTVEIVKVLYRGADILILDEPTAVLTPQETEKLFTVLRNMKADGKAIVIITHKLHEVMALSDKVAVLRKGKYIGTVKTSETNPQALTDMMVGHSVTLNIDRPEYDAPVPRLTLKGITCYDGEGVKRLDNVSFTALGGEILGIAGIAGSGQRELLEAIAGLHPVAEGSIRFTPRGQDPASGAGGQDPHADQKGRRGHGLRAGGPFGHGSGWLHGHDGQHDAHDLPGERARASSSTARTPTSWPCRSGRSWRWSPPAPTSPVRRLSGGNVQKVLVGREIATAPSVLMTAYAVRGLDINTSYTIYNLLTKQKMQGVAVIYVGEDLDVLLELCDRILVLCGGKVSGIVDGRTTTKEEVGLLMTRVRRKGEGALMHNIDENAPDPPGQAGRHGQRGPVWAIRVRLHPAGAAAGRHWSSLSLGATTPFRAYGTIVTGALGKKTAIRQTVKIAIPLLGCRPGHRSLLQDALLEHRRRGPDHRRRHAPPPTSPSSGSAQGPPGAVLLLIMGAAGAVGRRHLGADPRLLQGPLGHQRDSVHPDDELHHHRRGPLAAGRPVGEVVPALRSSRMFDSSPLGCRRFSASTAAGSLCWCWWW